MTSLFELFGDQRGYFEMNGVLSSGAKLFRYAAGAVLTSGCVMFCASTAQAASLGQFNLGTSIYTESGLDIVADGSLFEASAFAVDFVLVGSPLDGSDGVDTGNTSDFDLDINDFFFDPIINGRAHDIEIDAATDTVSILFEVSFDNILSTDDFVVAELLFSGFDIMTSTSLADLDGELADLTLRGATSIPLPAGLPLLLAGIGSFIVLRRAESRKG